MKLNLKELSVQISPDGTTEQKDLRKDFGNFLWNYSQDIGLSDVGRDIYRSDGEIEIPETYRDAITELVNRSTYFAPVKRAILKQIDNQ